MTAMPAWASSIANNYCSPDGPGSGTWSNVAGCYTNAGAQGSLHNLGETVIGSYGYVPTNISFGTIFGFAGQANAMYGTALGANGVVSSGAQNSVALGSGSVATDPNTVSVGRVGNNPLYNVHTDNGDGTGVDATPMNQSLLGTLTRRITNMSAGINDNDAVNVSQVKGVTKALGGGAGVNSDGSIAAPKYAVQGANFSDVGSALSKLDSATTANSTSITNIQNTVNNISNGNGFKYVHVNSSGADSVASGTNAVAVGVSATGAGQSGVALGSSSLAKGDWSEAIGNSAQANALGDIALGASSTATGGGIKYFHSNSTLADSVAAGADSVAIGGGASAAAANSVALGAGSTTTANLSAAGWNPGTGTLSGIASAANGEVSVGASGKERRITNVAAGYAATDAVNVSQLQSEDAKVNAAGSSIANVLGGGSTYDASTGTITGPAFTLGGKTVTSIAGAITNLDDRVTQNSTSISNIMNQIDNGQFGSLVQQVSPTGAVTVAASTGGTLVNFAGTAGARVLTGVANGSVNASSKDAVNGSQLYATNQNLANLTNVVNNISTTGSGTAAQSKYFHANSTLADSSATGTNATAIGGAASASGANSVALGSGSVADSDNTVSVGSAGNERRITNVADAVAGTDAVNYAQMNAALAKVQNAPAGSDAMVAVDGDRVTEAASVNGTHAMAMGPSASAKASQAIASGYNAQASGDSSIAMGANSKATAERAVALGDGSIADRANTVSVGSADNQRQITNVAAGTQTTDAVNVGQLNSSIAAAIGDMPAGMSAKDYTDQQIQQVQAGVNDVARNAYSGIAAATALTMIPDVDQGKTIAVGIGGASYKGYAASALGISARITQNIKVKAGAGISAQGTTFGVGGSYQW
ncbi:outer membrane protein [Paraburkholderia hospita]|nr:outer membrane protein [Paraburkholderia hospita]